ncbi:tripartite tricarboxylate transporter substrate binding protein [Candidimonas humi]|uniref:Bug family tripartite tricarboxylate transporter substrate binding protein n=1 Tax=Candidimonas humi TaxID=683355 RepID=A0ABV8P2I0_9BURK|nr:tripartite tricarboxylate transporter substrate binding protein [Candidimonas humi]MBV6306740.1 tripartite tricarboxylate transporter substrate binding protein [Candidimonas humi]
MLKTLANILIALPALALCHSAAAATYPAQPIKLVVPYTPGASTDTLARLVAASVSKQLGQSVIVENKPGAGGIIASDYVKQQKPDGYTFMLTTDGILSVNPSVYKRLPYDPLKDFTPLTIAVAVPDVLVVQSSSAFKSLQDVVAYAKAHPDALSFGSAGIGSSLHIAGELFNEMAGIKTTHVPYKGGSAEMNNLLGGHVSMIYIPMVSAVNMMSSGKIRVLGIGSAKRNPMLPDVPTFDEQGLKGYDSDTWYGFNMPAGADARVAATLHDAIVKALAENAERLRSMGFTIVAGSGQDMDQVVRKDIERWRGLIQKAGLYHQQ